MFIDLFSEYGDMEAMGQVMDEAPELSLQEDTRGYSLDDLYAVGAAKQAAIDEHNLKLEYTDESILGGIYGNWKHNTGTGVLFNKAFEERQEVDPEFDISVAKKSVEPMLLTPANQETLSSAKNQRHFDIIADNLRDYEDHKLNMEKLGGPLAFATQGIAEFANVINWVPFLRAFGLSKLKTFTDVAKVSAFQGAANAAEEKLIDTAYNDRSTSSYVAAFGMGAAFTGALAGGAKVMNNSKASMKRMKEASDNAEGYAAVRMQDKVDETVSTAKNGAEVDRDYTNSGVFRDVHRDLDPKIEKSMTDKGLDPKSEIDIVVHDYMSKGLIPVADTVPQEKIGLAGFAQTLARSANDTTRYINRVLFEHGEGNYGHHKEHTAALESELEYYRLMSGYAKSYIEAKGLFGTLVKDSGIKVGEFDRLMYRYMDGGHAKLDPRVTPELKSVMDDFQKVYEHNNKEVGKHAQEAGVEEFQSGAWKEGKLSRKYSSDAFHEISMRHGDDGEGIKVMLEESINRAGGFKKSYDAEIKASTDKYNDLVKEWEITEKKLAAKVDEHKATMARNRDFTKRIQAEARLDKAIRKLEAFNASKPKLKLPEFNVEQATRKIAEAVYNRMHNRSVTNTADANLFTSNNQNLLMAALKDGDMPKATMVHIQKILDNQGRDLKADPFADQIKMDMSVTRVVNGEEISMLDLLDVDLAQGYASSQRYWIGRSALARKGDHFASEAAIHRTFNEGALKGAKAGLDSKQIQKELDMQQKGVNLILGQVLEQQKGWTHGARIIRKLVASSSLGKLGIIQAGETGRMVGAVEASMRFPMIRDLISGVVTGKMNTASYKSIEDAVVGNMYNRNFLQHAEFRAEDFGVKAKPVEKTLDKLGYYLSKASGWNMVHKSQMMALTNTLSQQWYRQIMDGTMKKSQMNDLGVSDLLMKELRGEMKKHAVPIEGLSGKKTVMELNPDEWHPHTRRAFGQMLHRKSTNAIQDINVGETPMWLNTEMGKFLGQFRTFSIAALSKQTTRDYKMLREGDMEAAVSMAFNTATSVMANVAKIGFVAATLPGDARDEYLAKALNPASIANQILSYTGPLSPLMEGINFAGDTMLGDTWGKIAGSKMGFRANGLTALAPGINYINKGFKGASGILSSTLTDKNLSKADYRSLYSTIPFSNNYMFETINNRILTPAIFKE